MKNEISTEPIQPLELSKKTKIISLSKEYETDIITLFHAAGDFSYRSQWQDGVKKVEELNHFLPRIGVRCRCVMENGQVVIYASSYSYHPERIEFSETDEVSKNLTYYLLEKTGENKTKLTIDFYLHKNIVNETIFKLARKKKLENSLQKSLINLQELVKTLDFRMN